MPTNRPLRFLLFFFVLVNLILLPVTFLLAHSGRTDKDGGHWNRKTDTYHFHSSPSPTPSPVLSPKKPIQIDVIEFNLDFPPKIGIVKKMKVQIIRSFDDKD